MQEFELIAKTFQGLEEVLAQELTELGANNIQLGRRAVTFTGDKAMMYRANFCLRTAVRILKPIAHFQAADPDQVYEAVRAIDWEQYLDNDTTFAVDTAVFSDEFRHSKFVAYKVKDAICDYFRDKTGQRPSISITNPDVKLNIHIAERDCTLSLDSSGESLHLRGYRVASVEAPINEVLAAALIKMTGWHGECDFIDPFCGSGTLLIEAALMARNIYPGVFRKAFGFEKWKDFDRDLLDEIYNDDSQERPFDHRIYGYDINLPAIEAATENVKSAGVADFVTLKQQDFRDFKKPAEPAIMVTNPPYGQRLTPPDLLNLYQAIGSVLKKEFTGGEAWIISSKQELFENIGLRASVKIQVLNGQLDCDFRKYQLFEGRMGDYRAQGGTVKTDKERRFMENDRRRQRTRDDFKQRLDEPSGFGRDDDRPFDDDDELANHYRILSGKHREFERSRMGRRSDGRGGDRPRFNRDFKSRDGGSFRKKEGSRDRDGFRGNDSEGGFRSRDGFRGKSGDDFRKRDGFRGKSGDGFRKRDGFRGRDGGNGFRKGGGGFRRDDRGDRRGGFEPRGE